MKIFLLILGFLASAFGMIEALVGFVFFRHKAHLFADHFGFTHPLMLDAYARFTDRTHPKYGRSYHNLKNLWPTWLETNQERPSKAIALLTVLLIITIIGIKHGL